MRQRIAADLPAAHIFEYFPQAAPVGTPGPSASTAVRHPNHLRTHPAGNRKEDS